jgi:RimJ/RimL family protein N-acetyltransferase
LKIVKAVLGLGAPVDVVIGPSQSLSDDLISEFRGMKSLRIWHNLECLANLFSQASLALGAGGTSSWERACLGVPSLISSVAENQRQNCVSLSEVGAAVNLGDSLALEIDAGCAALAKLLESSASLMSMEHHSKLLVDGLGCKRILKVLMQVEDVLSLRAVTDGDIDLLFSWRNELEVQRNSLESREVTWGEHEQWFRGLVRNGNSPLFILEADGLPVGQLRLQVKDNIGTLTYSVDQDFRGRGYGKYMIMRAKSISKSLNLVQLFGTVRSSNEASRRVFEQCGFTLCSEHREILTYQFRLR